MSISVSICIRPSDIRYTQESISCRFQIGKNIGTVIKEIMNEECKISDIPEIEVMVKDGVYYSADNRRLYIFKILEAKGLVADISVRLVKRIKKSKWTTKTQGLAIDVRGQVIDFDPEE
ncbi:hypothetical protein ACJMK2_035032 [Sinanodonta woodiana]|uniref:Uncharacterized protein n=1 Tax=Sinanodonta woodiana TaxID=1069815 RepID=A0ABD3WU30_SINWO